jgi:hypothetical protein
MGCCSAERQLSAIVRGLRITLEGWEMGRRSPALSAGGLGDATQRWPKVSLDESLRPRANGVASGCITKEYKVFTARLRCNGFWGFTAYAAARFCRAPFADRSGVLGRPSMLFRNGNVGRNAHGQGFSLLALGAAVCFRPDAPPLQATRHVLPTRR